MLRVLLWIFGIPLVLLIVAAILIPLLLDEEKLVALASDALREQSGATLEVRGGASLSVLPQLGLKLEDATLTLPADDISKIDIGELTLGMRLMPLLSGKVEIQQLAVNGLVAVLPATADEPTISTSGMSDAQLDAYYAKRRKAISEASEKAGAQTADDGALTLNVAELSIRNSRFEQVDADTGERTVIELVRLQARDINLGGSVIPLELELRLPQPDAAQPLEIKMAGEVRIDNSQQRLFIDGIDASIEGATAEKLTFSTSGEIEMDKQIVRLQLKAAIGDTRADGKLRFAAFESPQIDAELHLNLFDPALLVLAGPDAAEAADTAAPASPSEGDTTSGDTTSGDEPLPLHALRAIDSEIDLTIDKALIEGHEITGITASLRALEGVINLSNVTGTVHGGKLQLQALIDASHSSAQLTTSGGLADLDIASALQAMDAAAAVSGRANATWELKSSGSTRNQLLAALQGPIVLDAANTVLEDVAVEQMLCKAVALANQATLDSQFPASSSFDTLNVRIQLEDGKAKLSPLSAELPGVKLRGEGRLNLLEQNFSAEFAARLSPELGEIDPACSINERYTSLDWPVECKGDLSGDPGDWCGVDTEEIIKDLAGNEAKRKIGKEAGKLLDNLFKR